MSDVLVNALEKGTHTGGIARFDTTISKDSSGGMAFLALSSRR